ncbi:histone-lysine N-methyltransferase SETDB1-like [Stylophora pistillata]|uniref:histone-lysine N-methyltransferase SETDB1-like n=1 Tax=Stylophora pistillata TaxID=50429 RepID=UPI000C0445A6|nr:histone-lysine N-methyltransferase SETDB1-like [Stylophora pistillata]
MLYKQAIFYLLSPRIYECNQNCACASQCFNRVVQNGIQLRLQVFKTENRGWGLRTLDDIPLGTFVCTYAGQILNEDMANKEGRDFGDEYLAELDHIEVVEKAKEGYESNVSDLEEDDSVIYQTLCADSSSSGTASANTGESSLSGDESSEVDSVLSEESYSSGRNLRVGDGENIPHKSSRRKKRKRSERKGEKRKRILQGEESLMVEGDSKAVGLSNLADENWCYIALQRNQKDAAAYLKKVITIEKNGNTGVQVGADSLPEVKEDEVNVERDEKEKEGNKQMKDDEKNVGQSSDFDFDDVDESFCQKLRNNTLENSPLNSELNIPGPTKEENITQQHGQEKNLDIIDLTSDNELDNEEFSQLRESDFPLNPSREQTLQPQIKREVATLEPEKLDKQEKLDSPVKPVEDTNSDSAPSLISAEDLSKLAAKNATVADEPPILTKMNPAIRRVPNQLDDMILRLKKRVLKAQPSQSDSGVSSADRPTVVDFERSGLEVLDKRLAVKSSLLETAVGIGAEPLSEPSSPETENMESFPPSPSSLRSDLSKSESLDRKSEISTGSSRRSTGASKQPAKKLKTNNPKIHSQQRPTTNTPPSLKASPNTPSPSRPSLSRQSSVSSKRLSTRVMFGEEHCYVIDAKGYGNCGRYLNHSCSPNLFVQNVFVDTHDLRFPWVAFFTQQNVAAGTELTWDYAYEVDSVKGKVLHCYCGSAECRGRLL